MNQLPGKRLFDMVDKQQDSYCHVTKIFKSYLLVGT